LLFDVHGVAADCQILPLYPSVLFLLKHDPSLMQHAVGRGFRTMEGYARVIRLTCWCVKLFSCLKIKGAKPVSFQSLISRAASMRAWACFGTSTGQVAMTLTDLSLPWVLPTTTCQPRLVSGLRA